MAVRILFDTQHNVIEPTFVLATRNGTKLGVLPAVNVQLSDNMNSYFDLSFKVYRYDGTEECRLWDQIKDFKLMWCREWDVWFEIYVETSEEEAVVKNVSARSLGEAELSQINLYGIEINTENDIAQDDYIPAVLYDDEKPRGSLLTRIMEKAPHYKVKHVDSSIAKIQRTFEFDGKSLYDAFQEIAEEIDCIFIINSGSNDDGSIERSISVYDLESYCLDCGKRGDFIDTCPDCGQHNIQHGYGEDTGIFICPENLASNITYSTDTDSVKNCFRLEAGDELMTATVRNCNPNGTDYIWYISDETKSDMSEELVTTLDTYNEQYEYYQKKHEIAFNTALVQKYNALVDKYSKYNDELEKIPDSIVGYPALMNVYYDAIDFEFYLNDELMPDASIQSTSAGAEVSKLTTRNLSPVAVQDLDKCSAASATSAVLAMAKVLVDSRYKVKIQNDTYTRPSWSGEFVLTNYSDEEDTATSGKISVEINENYERFVRQRIDIALKDKTVDAVSLTELFKLDGTAFTNELQKYCLQRLISFHDGCQTCIDVLIEQGIANNETWADKDPNMYNEVYIPYRNRLLAIEAEMKVREDEIAIVAGRYDADGTLAEAGIKTLVEDENAKIQEALDFEKYLGEELWLEFAAYRREDTYQNDNYISDGLNNAELFENAREFIEVAEKDIYKSATLQHSISATLKNLLVMKEFEPIVDYFCVGNWLRVQVDGKVYRLRLISYQIDFDNPESLTVTFSDVKNVADGLTDSQSILDQAASMSSSYGSVSRQAGQGKKSAQRLGEWVDKGLALTNMKIVGNADNQNITWDNHGILCKEYLPMFDEYDDRQLKIINRGIYLTDDAWLTARAGIGNFMYFDPEDGQTKESYGVIADTLIGNLILSKKVGIYNENNSITLDENGLTLKAYPYEGSTENAVFRIVNMTKEPGEDTVWIDENGNAHFRGEITATALTIYDTDIDEYLGGKIGDSADGLREEFDGKLDITKQEFSVKNGELNSYIEGVESDLNGYKGEVSSQFRQTADEFDSRIQSSQTYLEGKIDDAANEAAEALAQQVLDFNSDIADLQKQLDKHVMTWFYDGVPTPDNEPAMDWKTVSDKEEHLGDLYYDTTPGFCYRWNKQGTEYLWEKVEDKDIIQSLQDAAKAQDTADHKRRVFFDTPVPPYDMGDMWVNANYSGSTVTYKDDILRCKVSQPESGSFKIEHWTLASKYTDDSALDKWIHDDFQKEVNNLKAQADQKAETWYQSEDPSKVWAQAEDAAAVKKEHIGDMWYCTNPGDATHYQKYWRWNGTAWDLMTSPPPDEMFDRWDGKAQVFVNAPNDLPDAPYYLKDLWVQGGDGEIMKCVTECLVKGQENIKHWEKASKYTDDSYAKDVEITMTTEIQQTQDMIKLLADKTTTTTGEYGDLMERLQHAEFKLTPEEIVSTVRDSTEYQNDFNSIGARNYVLDSDVKHQANNSYWLYNYTLSEPFELNQTYTCTIWGELAADKEYFSVCIGNSKNWFGAAKRVSEGVYSVTATKESLTDTTADKTKLQVYTYPSVADSTSRIDLIKFEKGPHRTDWSPAPEEIKNSMSRIEQTADMIKLLVTSDSNESSLTLTDNFIEVLTDNVVMTDKLIQFVVGSDGIQDINEKAAKASSAADKAMQQAIEAEGLASQVQTDLAGYEPSLKCLRFDPVAGLVMTAYNDSGKQSIWSTHITNQGFAVHNSELQRDVFYAYQDRCLVQNFEVGSDANSIKVIEKGTPSGGVVWTIR